MKLRKGIRILGIDDGAFPDNKRQIPLAGVVYRGGEVMEGLILTQIVRDGFNATGKIIKAVGSSRFYEQLHVIITSGITTGGFNLIDIRKLSEKLNLPVLSVVRRYPDIERIYKAIENLGHPERRRKIIERAGPINQWKDIFYQSCGLTEKEVDYILRLTVTHSKIPEPIRIAHIIGAALTKGESRGRA